MDGPGTCAGRLEIQYEGQWRRVAKDGWTADNSDAVCRQQGCGNSRKSASADKFSPGSGDFFNKAVTCKKNALHISECTIGDSITVPSETAEITCEGECFFHSSLLPSDLLLGRRDLQSVLHMSPRCLKQLLPGVKHLQKHIFT